MKLRHLAVLGLFMGASVLPVMAQDAPAFTQHYVSLPDDAEGLLYKPTAEGPNNHIAVLFSHPNRDNFGAPAGAQMAQRGYNALMVNFRGEDDYGRAMADSYLPSISEGIKWLREQEGIDTVILLQHSGGTHIGTFYVNVAENGPGVCSDDAKVLKCDVEKVADLAKPDGLVLLDPTLGAGHNMSAIDPAWRADGTRDASVDMFDPANGFDKDGKKASYSPEFLAKFYAAQSARNNALIDEALARLALIEAGQGEFPDDEPFIVRGVGVGAAGARPYQLDVTLAAHTKNPHLLLKADGTEEQTVITSVRPASGANLAGRFNELDLFNYVTTVKRFLGDSAIRTTADYAFSADGITGIDWDSAFDSSPSAAKGITVPSLVVSMTCHYLMVPAELIFDNLASADKTMAAVEGAQHGFRACGEQYGNTTKRLFDYVDRWINENGRFPDPA